MLQDIPVEEILRLALKRGGEYADLFLERTQSTLILCEEDRIEKVISGLDVGVGLRILFDHRTVYGFTNELSRGGLRQLAEAVSGAVEGGEDQSPIDLRGRDVGAFPSCRMIRPISPVEKDPRQISIEKKVSVVHRANEAARRLDPHVKQVKVFYCDVIQALSIANTEGVFVQGERVGTILSVQVVCAKGEVVQTGYEPIGGSQGFELFNSHPPETVAEVATQRCLLMLSAKKAPMGRMPVVLSSEAGGTMIHEAIGHGLEADLAQQGLSVYSGKIGEQVASPLITVVDDATLPGRRGSYAFDDEGRISRRTLLVEEGVLKGYLYDRLTALKDGAESTGNGRRESYQHRPIPRMSNTLILPGKTERDKIIRSVEKGVFVKKMGGGQVNTVNGDFVFEVSEGYLIEKGEIGDPIRGAILTGNGPQILKEIDMVGDDLGFGIGTCGKEGQAVPVSDAQPTLRIPEIIVGGQEPA